MVVRLFRRRDRPLLADPFSRAELFPAQINEVALQDAGASIFSTLRDRWGTIPFGSDSRFSSAELLSLPDHALRAAFVHADHAASAGTSYSIRGWYRDMYAPIFNGKRVLEVGSGAGLDAIFFSRAGANWYCSDVARQNLKLVNRAFSAFDMDPPPSLLIEDLSSFSSLPIDFDFVYCQGSMICVPSWFARLETQAILPHLKDGGRWIELGYPHSRWEKEGRLPAEEWGIVTDGPNTPWMEWLDAGRFAQRFEPIVPTLLLNFEFHGSDFNWIDARVSKSNLKPQRSGSSITLVPFGQGHSQFSTRLICHNGSKVKHRRYGIDIRTNPQRWSYALELPISCPSTNTGINGYEVVVKASVRSGRIGFGLLQAGSDVFVEPEVSMCSTEAPEEIRLGSFSGDERLMIRNHDSVPSSLILHSVQLQPMSGRTDRYEQQWQTESQAIDLSRALNFPNSRGRDSRRIFSLVRAISPNDVASELDLPLKFSADARLAETSPRNWTMEGHDSLILGEFYRVLRPERHLEFGTWRGFGVCLCLDNSPNTLVTTLNLPDGEFTAHGNPAYPLTEHPNKPSDAGQDIGILYKEAGYSSQVDQVLIDSTEWTPGPEHEGFDTALIDGGHEASVVINDTLKALKAVRPGGYIFWHDFAPVASVLREQPSATGVCEGVLDSLELLYQRLDRLFWIRPSFLLVGRKAADNGSHE